MKKTIYSIFALSLAFFSSCTEEMFESRFQTSGNEITFALEELGTRATPIEDSETLFDAFESFDVVAYDGGTKVFEDVLDNNMAAQKKHYWPETTTNYDFFVMPQPTNAYKFTLKNASSNGEYKFNYEAPTPDGETDGVAAADLVMAHAQANSGQVGLTFEHLLAGVRFVYANPLVAHHVKYVGVQNATMNGQIVYSNGEFSWASQSGSGNLYQAVDADVMKVNSQIHEDNAHFMLIPGGNKNEDVTFSVIMDNNQAYNLNYSKSDLKAGKILTINIGDPASEQEAVPGIGATKEYTKNSDGSYTLRIETYVTGEQEIVTEDVPTDIALVVDVSGSMDQNFYIAHPERGYSYNDIEKEDLYYKWGSRYYKVNTSNLFGYYQLTITRFVLPRYLRENGNPSLLPTDAPSKRDKKSVIWNGVLYSRYNKMDATKNALNAFIDQVNAKNENNIHQITLISYSSSSQIVKDWDNGADDFKDLKGKVDALSPNGATRADLGMANAASQFAKIDSSRKSEKVVVMLTDGSPTSGSSFSETVANATINSSYNLKNIGAKVWTIYIGEEGASTDEGDDDSEEDPTSSLDEKVNKYMNLVSSNSTTAKDMNSNDYDYSLGYFTWAKDTDELEAIFTQISNQTGGSSQTQMDEKTVLSDVISPVFDLSDVDVSDMDIYAIDYATNLRVEVSGITPNLSNSTITVTGFDYSKYFWGVHTDKNPGRKLVIVLKLTPKAGLDPGTYVTNGAGSGLYVGGTMVSPFTNATEGKNPEDPNTIVIPTKN